MRDTTPGRYHGYLTAGLPDRTQPLNAERWQGSDLLGSLGEASCAAMLIASPNPYSQA